jgi:hypothetical protein
MRDSERTDLKLKKPSEARFLRAGVPENRHVVIVARDSGICKRGLTLH